MDDPREGADVRAYRIHGRVQGVGFRWWARRMAVDLGVGGSVRNLSDGSVEVHASGRVTELDRFEEELRRGPPGARVDSIDSVDPLFPPQRGEFRVLR